MQRITAVAGILLLLQIGLVALFTVQDKTFEPYRPNISVVSFQPKDVDSIKLKGKDGGELVLQKDSGEWFITGNDKVPADNGTVNDFLAKLAGFKRGLAVAATKEAAARFEVSSDNFASHLVLKNGDKIVADIYFGTSSGFKQLHSRTAESTDIITVALGSHEVSADAQQWIEKNLLRIDKKKLLSLKLDGITISRGGEEAWKAVAQEGTEKYGQEIDALVEKFCGLNVLGTAGVPDGPGGNNDGAMSISSFFDDQSQLEYRISQLDENSYAVKRSDFPYVLSVSGWQIDELKDQLEKVKALFTEGEAADGSPAENEANIK